MQKKPPQNIQDLRQAITDNQSNLSSRVRDAARYLTDNPHMIALNTIALISEKSGIASATYVRLAKCLGYSGFSDLQQVFKAPLQNADPITFTERIKHHKGEQVLADPTDISGILREFSLANIISLEHLAEGGAASSIEHAISLLAEARTVYVVGMRRSFPIASYLSYALSRVGCSTVHLTGLGGTLAEQIKAIRNDDLLVAISFPPYSDETIMACTHAKRQGVRILSITDSILSPIAENVTDIIEVSDAELLGFRSLTASLCVTQTLAMGLAFRRSKDSNHIFDREFLQNIDC